MNYRRYIEYQALAPFSLLQTFFVGVLVGVVTWLVYLGLTTYVLTPALCTPGNQMCSSASTFAVVTGLMVANFVGLIAMIRLGLLRPLLIVLASILTLWGFHAWLSGATWWLAMLYVGLLFGLAYVTYTWINRFLFFPLALALTVIFLVVARILVGGW